MTRASEELEEQTLILQKCGRSGPSFCLCVYMRFLEKETEKRRMVQGLSADNSSDKI